MQIKNVKQLRKALKGWGKFWRAKQLNDRPATSITEKACEVMRKGIFVAGTSHLSHSISVPEQYRAIDEAIERLSKHCRLALIGKYIKNNHDASGYWIDSAERALLGML